MGGEIVGVIVFHFTEKGALPKLSQEWLITIRSEFLGVFKDHPGVHFNGTYVDKNRIDMYNWEALKHGDSQRVISSPPTDPVIEAK